MLASSAPVKTRQAIGRESEFDFITFFSERHHHHCDEHKIVYNEKDIVKYNEKEQNFRSNPRKN